MRIFCASLRVNFVEPSAHTAKAKSCLDERWSAWKFIVLTSLLYKLALLLLALLEELSTVAEWELP